MAITLMLAAAAVAAEKLDEVEIKRPLPVLATPDAAPLDQTFSREVPPPPAFDPTYQPPNVAKDKTP